MREMKFRAWNIYKKNMLYTSFFDRCWYYTPKNDDEGCNLAFSKSQRDSANLKIMQYIGLKDKNGNEIYEGDILKNRINELYKIQWANINLDYCGFVAVMLKTNENRLFINSNFENSEIIGNIYENYELLENL